MRSPLAPNDRAPLVVLSAAVVLTTGAWWAVGQSNDDEAVTTAEVAEVTVVAATDVGSDTSPGGRSTGSPTTIERQASLGPVPSPGPTDDDRPGDREGASGEVVEDATETVPLTTVVATSDAPVSPEEPVSSIAERTSDGVPVERLVMVPPIRDVFVDVGGELVATNADGVIELGAVAGSSVLSFVGTRADPPLREISFVRWSDGSTSSSRLADDLPGPVTQVGIESRTRVFVEVDAASAADAVVFESEAVGDVTVEVGEPTRVIESTVEQIDGSLRRVDVTYTAVAMVVDGELVPTSPQDFSPTPEALWEIRP